MSHKWWCADLQAAIFNVNILLNKTTAFVYNSMHHCRQKNQVS